MVQLNKFLDEVFYAQCPHCLHKIWTLAEAYISMTEDCPSCSRYMGISNYTQDFKNAMTAKLYAAYP
jgi:hypothetical protein